KEEQASGVFAGGAILENKPIGFPQDGGGQKPFSNLFYWANAWSDNGGLIGEHPHKMFEIMSFVIEGEIQHYDSKMDGWISLNKGDAQIIRSGNGITHAERIMEGGRMFQIWFDPNIKQSMLKEATYDDYKSADMKYHEENEIAYKDYIGNGGPIKMDSEGVLISELTLPAGNHQLKLDESKIHSYYFLGGEALIDGQVLLEHDFVIVEDEGEINIVANLSTRLFHIATPKQLSYKTYLELVNN
ncbi:MAG: pirin family protein, partial [Flavobacteriales bacterium]|nr:pirin family protein [Flavobacteriales bacterium]